VAELAGRPVLLERERLEPALPVVGPPVVGHRGPAPVPVMVARPPVRAVLDRPPREETIVVAPGAEPVVVQRVLGARDVILVPTPVSTARCVVARERILSRSVAARAPLDAPLGVLPEMLAAALTVGSDLIEVRVRSAASGLSGSIVVLVRVGRVVRIVVLVRVAQVVRIVVLVRVGRVVRIVVLVPTAQVAPIVAVALSAVALVMIVPNVAASVVVVLLRAGSSANSPLPRSVRPRSRPGAGRPRSVPSAQFRSRQHGSASCGLMRVRCATLLKRPLDARVPPTPVRSQFDAARIRSCRPTWLRNCSVSRRAAAPFVTKNGLRRRPMHLTVAGSRMPGGWCNR